MPARILLFGPGYCGLAIAAAAASAGNKVTAVSRDPARNEFGDGIARVDFGAAEAPIAEATHLIATAPPAAEGDPVLARYASAIAAAPALSWIGYLSATSVYGDRGGGAVDEDTPAAPSSERGTRRLAAERAWQACARTRPLDLI